jgi:hypothetical protein
MCLTGSVPKKKKTSRPAVRQEHKPKVTKVHFFYIIAAVWVAGTALAYHVVTTRENAVLNASTQLARVSDAEGNNELSGEDASDSSKLDKTVRKAEKELRKAEKIKSKAQRKLEKKENGDADEPGDVDEVDDDIDVVDENGVEVKVKKNKKLKLLVLPDKAVQALLKNGIIDVVASSGAVSSESADQRVVYTRLNGKNVYIIAGTKEEKLFGAIPVSIQKTVTVSPETGAVIATETSLLNKFLDLLSF